MAECISRLRIANGRAMADVVFVVGRPRFGYEPLAPGQQTVIAYGDTLS